MSDLYLLYSVRSVPNIVSDLEVCGKDGLRLLVHLGRRVLGYCRRVEEIEETVRLHLITIYQFNESVNQSVQ